MSSLTDLAYKDLERRVRTVPHLDTGIRFDSSALYQEWVDLPRTLIRPYKSRSTYRPIADVVDATWHGAAFTSGDGRTFSNLSEIKEEATLSKRTPLCDLVPYMTRSVFSLGKGTLNNINRLMVMKAGGGLTWHSHWFDYPHSERGRIVLQIPIVMPPKFVYEVMDFRDYRFGDFGAKMPTIHTATYPVGQLWYFNSYHIHNVHNRDTYDRVTIMMYVDMADDFISQMMDQAERNYQGIRLNAE